MTRILPQALEAANFRTTVPDCIVLSGLTMRPQYNGIFEHQREEENGMPAFRHTKWFRNGVAGVVYTLRLCFDGQDWCIQSDTGFDSEISRISDLDLLEKGPNRLMAYCAKVNVVPWEPDEGLTQTLPLT